MELNNTSQNKPPKILRIDTTGGDQEFSQVWLFGLKEIKLLFNNILTKIPSIFV
jgi:hypothetical protein